MTTAGWMLWEQEIGEQQISKQRKMMLFIERQKENLNADL